MRLFFSKRLTLFLNLDDNKLILILFTFTDRGFHVKRPKSNKARCNLVKVSFVHIIVIFYGGSSHEETAGGLETIKNIHTHYFSIGAICAVMIWINSEDYCPGELMTGGCKCDGGWRLVSAGHWTEIINKFRLGYSHS